MRNMNRTMTVVALIAAAGLSTMAYTVPEQRALAWLGGFGGVGGCGFGFGCGGFFGFHKHIIQTISQTNRCSDPHAGTSPTPPPIGKEVTRGGIGGSGGAGGSGGQGGQGGKDLGDTTSTSKTGINQKANGGNSNGGYAGNANGGDARMYGNGDNQKTWSSDQQDQNQKDKQVVCFNTAVNNAGRGFGTSGGGLGMKDIFESR